MDVLATGTAQHYRACMDAMMADDSFDCVFVNFVTPFFVDNESIAREIVAVSQQRRKPLVCNLMTDKQQWSEVVQHPARGRRAVLPAARRSRPGHGGPGALPLHPQPRNRRGPTASVDVKPDKARKIMAKARAAGRTQLAAAEVYGILEAYKIPVAKWRLASSPAEAAEAAAEIGFPVVRQGRCRIRAAQERHGRRRREPRQRQRREARGGPDAESHLRTGPALLRAEIPPGGLEIIMGAKAEEGLGHAVVFGLGGIHVEVMKDVVFNLTPISAPEAREMLGAIKSAPLLERRARPGRRQPRQACRNPAAAVAAAHAIFPKSRKWTSIRSWPSRTRCSWWTQESA
ncbi:MAG: acetate--CoA ligase family protein [Desulfobacterales bacterium]|nr:acetate--CoA ligase family protein [Desulfobacterales bacterium]